MSQYRKQVNRMDRQVDSVCMQDDMKLMDDLQLRDQLLYLHNQILSVLTSVQLTRIFEQRVNFDLRRLLGGMWICSMSIWNDMFISFSRYRSLFGQSFYSIQPGPWIHVVCFTMPSFIKSRERSTWFYLFEWRQNQGKNKWMTWRTWSSLTHDFLYPGAVICNDCGQGTVGYFTASQETQSTSCRYVDHSSSMIEH